MDVTEENSFDSVKQFILSFKDKYSNIKKIIIENKSDIKPETENTELKKFINFYSNNYNLALEEISVKTGDNFEGLLNKIYNEVNDNSADKKGIAINNIDNCSFSEGKNEECKGSISLILLGNSNVGKTNFMTRYAKYEFNMEYMSSVGMNHENKIIKINNEENYKLTIWDTAGQERFRSIPLKYYKNADGVLLLYDLTNKKSFDDISTWMDEIKENSFKTEGEGKVVVYLIGNKVDLIEKEKEIITKKEKEELANKLGVKYYEVSCMWNLNIEEVMARIVLDCYRNNRINEESFQLVKQPEINATKKGGCCSSKTEKNNGKKK